MSRLFIRACAGVGLVVCTIAHATNVSGIIGTNTTWTTAGNPYIVTGNLLVDTLVTLTMQPGVEVRIDSVNYIMIKGTLTAIGTATDSITITRNGTARWARLWFKSASPSTLMYCKINFAGRSAIYNENTGLLTIGNCTIDSCTTDKDDGGAIYNTGSIVITDNVITDNSAGYYSGGGISNDRGTATIINNIISNNFSAAGGGIANTGAATITNNTFTGNFAYEGNGGGVLGGIGQTIITGNTFSNNFARYGGAVFIYGGGSIRYNTITDTTAFAVYVHGSGTALIRTNNISATDTSMCTDADFNVDARYNFWNSTDTATISRKIHDFYDDFTMGKIIYKPFLNQAFSDTVAPASPLNLMCKAINDSTFVITWTNPSDPSGIAEYYYKTGDAPVSDFDTTGRFQAAPDTLHAAGGMLYVWLVDGSGNLNWHNSGVVKLSRAGIRESKNNGELHLSYSLVSNRSLTGHLLRYELPEATFVGISVFSLSGKSVKTVYSGMRSRGGYVQPLDDDGFSKGIYFIRFEAGSFVAVKKYSIVK